MIIESFVEAKLLMSVVYEIGYSWFISVFVWHELLVNIAIAILVVISAVTTPPDITLLFD